MAEQILNFLTDASLKMNGQHPILVLSGEVDFWVQKPEEIRFVAHQDNGLIVKPGDRQITSQSLELLLNASATKKPDMMASLILSKYPIGELQRLHQENLLTPEQLADDIKPVCVIAWAKLTTKPEVKESKSNVSSPAKAPKNDEQKSIVKEVESLDKPVEEVKENLTNPAAPVTEPEPLVKPIAASEPEKAADEKEQIKVTSVPEPESKMQNAEEQKVTTSTPVPPKTDTEKEQIKVASPVKIASFPPPKDAVSQVPVLVYQPKPAAPVPKMPVRPVQPSHFPSGTTTIRNPSVTIQQVRPNLNPVEPNSRTMQQQRPTSQTIPNPQAMEQKTPLVGQKHKDTISVLGYEVSTPAALMMGTFGLIGGCTALYFLTRNKAGHIPPTSATPSLPGPMMTPQFNLSSI